MSGEEKKNLAELIEDLNNVTWFAARERPSYVLQLCKRAADALSGVLEKENF